MKQKILHNYVIDEIQKYLAEMNWAQNTDYVGEKLQTFLRGVKYALWKKGIKFKFSKTKAEDGYSNIFFVEVLQYEDPADCWSKQTELFCIYENRIENIEV